MAAGGYSIKVSHLFSGVIHTACGADMPCELLDFGFCHRITSNGVFYPYLLVKLFSGFWLNRFR